MKVNALSTWGNLWQWEDAASFSYSGQEKGGWKQHGVDQVVT